MTTRSELSAAEDYGHGHTPLMRAALDGNTERVKELIHQGADTNQRDDNGRTALMFAVINMHYETMKVLLEYGADVNAKSDKGGTALMGAASAGDLRIVQALLDKGADLHARLLETNESAVDFAASHGYAEIERLLSQIKRQTKVTDEEVIMANERSSMKIVVIGGSGLIGSKVVTMLRERGHEAVAASPNSGVNTLTGEGLAEVLVGASVVVDVSNSPSFEDAAVLEFFKTSTGNLLTYEAAAGVGHHVALSIVGNDRLPDSGYMRAKVAQEKLIRESSNPYSIVRATQFFEFVKRIADSFADGNTVRVPPVRFKPMAADDVAGAVCRVAIGSPVNGIVEIGGPEQFRFDELIRQGLSASKDPREVIADPHARYFGTELGERSLVPDDGAQLGEIRFADWLSRSASQVAPTTPKPAITASSDPATLKENEFRASELPAGSALLVGEAAVFNVSGTFCATQAKCTHRQGPLSKGKLDGSTVTCPLHGSQFNVCTGEVLRGPATEPLATYRVIVDGDIGRVVADAVAAAKTISQNA